LACISAGPEAQKQRALNESNLPTIVALYDDADIAAAQPIIPQWKDVFLQAVPRPSAPTLGKYNEVSAKFWSAVHSTPIGQRKCRENLELLAIELEEMKGSGW
jgi:trehalose/maltose transport system substrate-binding protein